MTIAQALAEGGQTTIIGLSTVFSVLIILMIVITIMKMIFYKAPSKPAATAVPVAPEMPAPEPVKPVAADEMDDEELVAVITAAVAASLNTSTYNLRIKSLRRIDNKQPAWNRAGIRETINNRF